MRAKTKLPAGCLSLFVLERLHSFDCEHAWKSSRAVKIMTGPQRRRHVFIIGTDWLKRDTETNFKISGYFSLLFLEQPLGKMFYNISHVGLAIM